MKIKKSSKEQYTYKFTVPRSDTLLAFLLNKMPLSRNSIKNLLSGRFVLVNGNVETRHDFQLAKDDEIKISRTKILNDNKTSVDNTYKIKILYEDDYYIAIDKPSGLLSVESDKERISAYYYVTNYLKERNKNERAFILHRIDKDTSGVLVFSKDIKNQSKLRMHWNDDIIEREYYGVVSGKPEEDKGRIVSYLKENQSNLVYATNDPSGKKAITNYELVHSNGNYSLMKFLIETGRKNQIRVQMASIGCPIIGDIKYRSERNPINRLGLHASKLVFINPENNEKITIVAPCPKEFKEVTK